MIQPTREEARHVLWGETPELLPLALLTEIQLRWHDAWHSVETRDALKYVIRCSRRIGKSYWCLVEAVVLALSHPGAIVRYAAPTGKMVAEIIRPNMEHPEWGVWRTCPPHLRPRWRDAKGRYEFRNGSIIQIAGCNNGHYNDLRGVSCHLAVVDEARDVDELKKVIDDVLMPQTLTTGGRMLIASTPADSAAHALYLYDVDAESRGTHQHATIHDATHIPPERVAQYAEEVGGVETSTWKREYLAEWVVDEDLAVVPEFSKMEQAQPSIVREWRRPPFFDAYVAMDVGYHDLTVVGFAYRDFVARKTVVEDELVFRHATSRTIAEGVAAKELALWGSQRPLMRVVDAPEIVVADLNEFHGVERGRYAALLQYMAEDGKTKVERRMAIPWSPAEKDDKDAALNQLRIEIGAGDLIVTPKAKTVALHLRTAIWNKTRKSYARGDAQVGHFDGVDMAKYLVRHVLPNRNPYPKNWRGESGATHWMPPQAATTGARSVEGSAIDQALRRRTA